MGFGGGTQAVAPSPAPPEPLPRAVPAFPCLPAHANTLVLALPALFSPVPEPSTAEIRPHEALAGNRVEFVAPWIRLYPFFCFVFFLKNVPFKESFAIRPDGSGREPRFLGVNPEPELNQPNERRGHGGKREKFRAKPQRDRR